MTPLLINCIVIKYILIWSISRAPPPPQPASTQRPRVTGRMGGVQHLKGQQTPAQARCSTHRRFGHMGDPICRGGPISPDRQGSPNLWVPGWQS